MAQFTSKDRQRIIDDYLTGTGRNMFHAGEFIDWLSTQKKHEAYPWFFSKTDGEAAREYRIGLARQMASGLRIKVQPVEQKKGNVTNLRVREYPAYVSPVKGRQSGGGYERFDPKDEFALAELRRQAAASLSSWLRRYGAAIEDSGVDLTPLKETASVIEGRVVSAA